MISFLPQSNKILNLVLVSIYTAIIIYIQNKIFLMLIKAESKNYKKFLALQIITSIAIRIILPLQAQRAVEIFVRIIIYKKYLKIGLEKITLAEEVNITISTISELISIKLYYDISSKTAIILSCISFTIILSEVIAYIIFKKKNVVIDIPEFVSTQTKLEIIGISLISSLLIIGNGIIILKYIKKMPVIMYLSDLMLIVGYTFISNISMLKILKVESDENEIKKLENSNEILKHNYDTTCSFRHDLGNIMQGFGGFIEAKDIDGLKKMYNDVVGEFDELKESKSFSKEVINNPAIYNLINNKCCLAKKYNIKIKLGIYLDINSLKITTYELCRILGVLIDNAIEAAKECDEKVISIKFIKDRYNNRDLVIIENTCKNYLVDLNKINEKGFTTKKNKLCHGLGLWKVNQIVKQNENLRLYTSRDKMFKQQLEIYTWK